MCKSIYLINGLEEPPNEKRGKFVFSGPLSSTPSTLNLSLELQSFLKIFFN